MQRRIRWSEEAESEGTRFAALGVAVFDYKKITQCTFIHTGIAYKS